MSTTLLPFTKMQALGNDYLYVDCFQYDVGGIDLPALSRAVSDRHFGVGSDGLILIRPPTPAAHADMRMEMYNADGSRAEMCGNGIRCVAKYALDHGLVRGRPVANVGAQPSPPTACPPSDAREVRVETDRGVLALLAYPREGPVRTVRVDMGPPILQPHQIPVSFDGDVCVRQDFLVGEGRLMLTCVSMGNPHAVAFVPSLDDIDLPRLGPLVEQHPSFPHRVNFHVAVAESANEVRVRTWERGSGMTLACGTGACAVLVAGALEGRLDRAATVRLPGGDLFIEWPQEPSATTAPYGLGQDASCAPSLRAPGLGRGVAPATDRDQTAHSVSGAKTAPASVFMTGPAVEVFSGVWPLPARGPSAPS